VGALCNAVIGRATTIEHERSRYNGIGRQQLTVASAATAETTNECVEISPSADVNNAATRGGKRKSETEAGTCSLCSCAGSNQHYKNARRSPLKTMLTNATPASYLPRAYGSVDRALCFSRNETSTAIVRLFPVMPPPRLRDVSFRAWVHRHQKFDIFEPKGKNFTKLSVAHIVEATN